MASGKSWTRKLLIKLPQAGGDGEKRGACQLSLIGFRCLLVLCATGGRRATAQAAEKARKPAVHNGGHDVIGEAGELVCDDVQHKSGLRPAIEYRPP
jgi:hypothetical protein